jgi:hypothetical protein
LLQLEAKSRPFDTITVSDKVSSKVSKRSANRVGFLPHGIVEPYSDMELKPLWLTRSAQSKDSSQKDRCLLAIPAGIDQKRSVDAIMKKFLPENFTVMLFHYDGNVDGWNDLPWSKSVIHIAASNQTKWYGIFLPFLCEKSLTLSALAVEYTLLHLAISTDLVSS